MLENLVLSSVNREFAKLKKLGDQAIGRLTVDELNRIPADGSNSVALIIKHLRGNMVSRWTDFLVSDGEKPDRDRDAEFEGGYGTKEEALAAWEEGWRVLFGALATLTPGDLLRTVTIRGEPHSVIDAIHRQLAHYAYHVGQIVLLAKWMKGTKWESLSIPKGQSEEHNREMWNKHVKNNGKGQN
ncbi:DUF1572 family protein [Staphylospora marina]|uniref:DUF1572 family protein n=1 Tax=Staphylospora marina TaxID=2490858 RepID=UPI000F5C22A7|nr:DUF1572 family protein [Staphylospora marina]